jgi:CheY-like chemotaxis protein
MPLGGELAIHAAMSTVGADVAAFEGLPASGDYIVVTVSDDGAGIPADVLTMVFDPFFTTKRGGSGLGLSMVYGFARQSQGHVTVASETGCGTVVTLYLPCATGTPATPAQAAPLCQRFVRSVLVVEDDPNLRAHLRMLIEALGNTATAAADGEEALILLQSGLHFDILLTDIMMPGMSGVELAHEARRLRPALRVLLSSGYVLEGFDNAEQWPSGTKMLRKPYGKAELHRALDDA